MYPTSKNIFMHTTMLSQMNIYQILELKQIGVFQSILFVNNPCHKKWILFPLYFRPVQQYIQLWPDNNIVNIYEIVVGASLMDNCN